VQFEAASDNELVIGCAVRSVVRAPRSTAFSKISTQVNDSARKIRVMLTAAKKETHSASSDPCAIFPLAARGVYPKTRIRSSSEKTLHCFSATAPLSGNARRGWENSSGKTALGSALDNNGNTQSKADSTGATSYTWDFENRLSSVTLPGNGGTVSFAYDPFGRRIKKVSSTGTSIFAYDNDGNLVEETNSTGTAVARYAQGLHIDEPLAMLRSGATSYYNADGLGSITSLANATGSLAQTYTFDSFGKQTASSGSLTNPFQYTARELDTETSLYFLRARYLDTATGRFISEDPIGFRGSVNFYAYVKNRPIDFTDPSGLKDCNGHDCTKAAPLPSNSPKCDDYGNELYVGSSLKCFCKCAGDSAWSQQVRGCLACEHDKGTNPYIAHAACYAAGGLGNAPWVRLSACYLLCYRGNPPLL
jgi:RHS repeat-associated protein